MTGAGGPTCKLTPVAVDLRFPLFPCGPLHRAARDSQMAFPKMEVTVFYNLVLEVTYHHACCVILVTQTSPGTKWEGTTEKDWRQGLLGPSWRLATSETSFTDEKSEAERGIAYPRLLKFLSNS